MPFMVAEFFHPFLFIPALITINSHRSNRKSLKQGLTCSKVAIAVGLATCIQLEVVTVAFQLMGKFDAHQPKVPPIPQEIRDTFGSSLALL